MRGAGGEQAVKIVAGRFDVGRAGFMGEPIGQLVETAIDVVGLVQIEHVGMAVEDLAEPGRAAARAAQHERHAWSTQCESGGGQIAHANEG